ncbi:MAG: hypothetical protein ACFB02_01310 [Mastigocoleus sp.]
MFKIAKVLLASAVVFSSAALPASATNLTGLSKVNPSNYGVSRLSENGEQLLATGGTTPLHYVCIRDGYLNVRNARGGIIGALYKNTRVTVTANGRGRYQIRYGSGYGWVSSQYVCPVR